MQSLRKLVAMLGALGGVTGILLTVFVQDILALPMELTAATPPQAAAPSMLAIAAGVLCVLGALAIWRAPRLAGLVLTLGALGLVQGLGYTPFTLLPIGFAVVAAALALVVALNPEA